MATRPLTDPFELRSALSRRAPWHVPREELAVEVDAELARRRTAYPTDIRHDRMTREEADRHLSIWSAIADDHVRHAKRIDRLLAGDAAGAATVDDPPYRGTWEARVREVRRELALRRNTYPRRIASPTHPLDAATAAAKLDALDAVHWRYWMELWCFAPPNVDATADMARHRHVAERTILRLTPAWQGAIDVESARRAYRTWTDIAALADHVANGGTVGEATDHAARLRLHAAVDVTYHAALDDLGCAPHGRQAEVAQLAPLVTWLAEAMFRAAPVSIPEQERLAA